MTDRAFVKLNAHGPNGAGLTRRPPYPKDNLETEPPVHSSHLYVNDEAQGIKIGVWECTPHTSKMAPFPVNEFMILLEGSVTMLEKDGKATTVRAGEAFVVPKGAVCQWKQSEPVRKYFAIQGDALNKVRMGSGQPQAVTKAPSEAGKQAGRADGALAGLPFRAGETIYDDAGRGYSLGTWGALATDGRPTISQFYQMLRVETGVLTLADEDGATERFGAGDTVLILPRRSFTWSGSEDLHVLACSIKDDGAVAFQGGGRIKPIPSSKES